METFLRLYWVLKTLLGLDRDRGGDEVSENCLVELAEGFVLVLLCDQRYEARTKGHSHSRPMGIDAEARRKCR